MSHAKSLLLFSVPELTWNGSLPNVAPIAGAELLTDPGVELWDNATTPTAPWSKAIAGTSTVNREGTVKHGGSFAARLNVDGSNSNVNIAQPVTAPTGSWIRVLGWLRDDNGTSTCRLDITSNALPIGGQTLTASYSQYIYIGRITAPNPQIVFVRNSSANRLLYGDDFSAVILSLASLYSVRAMQQTNGIFINHPTRSVFTQAGAAHYADSNNQVVGYLDGGGNMRLDKNVAGTWTNLATVAVTYSAGAALALQRTGPSGNGLYSITYNGVIVIPATSLGNATFDALMAASTQWGNFSTYANNTFGAQSWTGPHDVETAQQHIIQVVGSALINYLPLNDAVAGGAAVDPQTGRNWAYGASNVSNGTGVDGTSAAVFGGAAAGQVVPSAGTLTALNGVGVFNPLEGTFLLWASLAAAKMQDANTYLVSVIGVDPNNRLNIYKGGINTLTFEYHMGGNAVGRTIAYLGDSFAHLALTWSSTGNFRKSYLNGVALTADTYAGTWVGALNNTYTQLASQNNGNYSPCIQDYMALSNRALSAAEIAALAKGAIA